MSPIGRTICTVMQQNYKLQSRGARAAADVLTLPRKALSFPLEACMYSEFRISWPIQPHHLSAGRGKQFQPGARSTRFCHRDGYLKWRRMGGFNINCQCSSISWSVQPHNQSAGRKTVPKQALGALIPLDYVFEMDTLVKRMGGFNIHCQFSEV